MAPVRTNQGHQPKTPGCLPRGLVAPAPWGAFSSTRGSPWLTQHVCCSKRKGTSFIVLYPGVPESQRSYPSLAWATRCLQALGVGVPCPLSCLNIIAFFPITDFNMSGWTCLRLPMPLDIFPPMFVLGLYNVLVLLL